MQLGGALSGRDTTAVHRHHRRPCSSSSTRTARQRFPTRTLSGRSDWLLSAADESRSNKRRIGSAEFRNTHFSYTMGEEGIERFVPTPELQSDDAIGTDPLPPGQVWAISPGGQDDNEGLYRIEVNVGPGSGREDYQRPCSWSIPRERQICSGKPGDAG